MTVSQRESVESLNTRTLQKPRTLDDQETHFFQHELLKWYARCGRDLPWRHTSDPYRILVSEIMLHQTQVDRVLPKYIEWLKRIQRFKH